MKKKEGFKGEKSIVLPEIIVNKLDKRPLNKLLYVTDIGYYPNARFHQRKRQHGSEQNILIYCTEGQGWIKIRNVKLEVKKDQYIIIPRNTPHEYGSSHENPWTIYWLHFSGEKSHLFVKTEIKSLKIGSEAADRFTDRILLFDEIYQNLSSGYSFENLEYANICLWHLLGSLKYYKQYKSKKDLSNNNTIDKCIEYIKENLDKPLTAQELASIAGFSESHFSLLFKKKTGQSPLTFTIFLKVQKACHLLEFTDLKVSEIALKLGYDDSFYFSRIFTKVMGSSPAKFRKIRLSVS
ncbi:MAG: AraC family transcriptional regulator [Cyclobacteriaceae bacterium]